jgi:hypothetical protein
MVLWLLREHRIYCIRQINEPLEELAFVDRFLQQDDKNYQAWGYRKFLLNTFDLFEEEEKNTKTLIEKGTFLTQTSGITPSGTTVSL